MIVKPMYDMLAVTRTTPSPLKFVYSLLPN